jgi:predicted Zn-dependent peptidase
MTDWDSVRVGFEVPTDRLTAATELLTEAVREPGFEPATLARVRDERLDEIRIERSQPAAMAGQALAQTIFRPGSRYAVSDAGDLSSVAGITDEAIRGHHGALIRPENATLVVVGDLGSVDVAALAATVFDGWSTAAPGLTESTVAAREPGRSIVVVDRPGSVQSIIAAGHDGPSRSAADYVPLTTMSMVLGGMFGSRLNLKLREEKGYAYGAFGGFDTRKHGGVFAARSAVQSEVTVPALTDLVGEIERMQAGGVEPDELEQARAYRAGVFPLSFAGALPVASGLGDIVVHGLEDDHYDRLRSQVLEVGKDEVDTAASRRLRPDDLSIVVVGDAGTFVDDLRAAQLGPVEVLTDEE